MDKSQKIMDNMTIGTLVFLYLEAHLIISAKQNNGTAVI